MDFVRLFLFFLLAALVASVRSGTAPTVSRSR
jgi:hypothetical protein